MSDRPKLRLIPDDFVSVSAQPLLPLLLRLSHLGVAAFDINNCGFAFLVAEKVSLLHDKITALTQRNNVVTLHRLIKSETVFGKFALRTPASLRKPAVGVAESVGFFV